MNATLPVLTLLSSLIPAMVIFWLPERLARLRAAINVAGALAKLAMAALMIEGVARGVGYEARLTLLPGLEAVLRVDALSLLFLTLSALLWLATTLYAIAYLGDGPNQSRFFGFFSLCVAATTGVALSGTLITFFVFYEMLTLATWPLVTHKGDRASLAAGRVYLAYTLPGGAALLVGAVWLEALAGPVDFAGTPAIAGLDPATLTAIFALLIGGLGVKAALVPLHGWLPEAMAAPAPVSALLHAVAVVKAGAFGIVRVVHDVFGPELTDALGLNAPLAALAGVTIVYGSLMALRQRDVKRRLAWSTVSQVSYIALGISLLGPMAMIGGLAHLVHQGLMKITLFFCAGALDERLGAKRVDQLDGAGRAMPWTAAAFTLGALGMVGLPPLAGFITKWQLGVGAMQAGAPWVLAVLAASSLLNAAYFLPLIHRLWFVAPAAPAPPGRERPFWLIAPAVLTAAASLGVGVLAGMPYSPLWWAALITARSMTP